MGTERGESLKRINEILDLLKRAIDDADEQFTKGDLDMDHYVMVSEELKMVADDFHSRFP